MAKQIHKLFSFQIISSVLFAFLLLTGITTNAIADNIDQKIRKNNDKIQDMRKTVNYLSEIIEKNKWIISKIDEATGEEILLVLNKNEVVKGVTIAFLNKLYIYEGKYSKSQLVKDIENAIKELRDKSNAAKIEIENITIPRLKRKIMQLEKKNAALVQSKSKQKEKSHSELSDKGILDSDWIITELSFHASCIKRIGQNRWMCNFPNGCNDSHFHLKSYSSETGKIMFDRTDLTCSFSKGLRAVYECTVVGDAFKDCKRKITNAGSGKVRPKHLLNKWQNVTIRKK